MLIPNIVFILLKSSTLMTKIAKYKPISSGGLIVFKMLDFFRNSFPMMKNLFRLKYTEFQGASFYSSTFFLMMHYISEIAGKVLKNYFLTLKSYFNRKVSVSLRVLVQSSKKFQRMYNFRCSIQLYKN